MSLIYKFYFFNLETSEDISPYATFQLSEVSALAHQSGQTNTLLHSFMYHERSPTDGCSSTPSGAICKTLISERKNNIYQKIVSTFIIQKG